MRALIGIIYMGVAAAAIMLPAGAWAQDGSARPTAGIARPGTAEAETATPGESSMPAALRTAPTMPKERASMQHVFDSLPPDMQEELLKETDYARALCNANTIFATYQDCDCIAVKFLDNRLSQGPGKHTYTVLNQVSEECVNQPAIAGYHYKTCLQRMDTYDPKYAVRIDEMCACTGKEVAKAYAYRPSNSLRYQTRLAVGAQKKCGYEQLMRDFMIDNQMQEAQKKNYLP